MAIAQGAAALPTGELHDRIIVTGEDRGIAIVSADTPALQERVYRLRYDVYCVAHEFEDPALQIAGYEQDKYDDYSVHSLLLDNQTGTELGSVRLILPNEDVSLPAYKVSSEVERQADILFPRGTTAEASRFLRAPHVSIGRQRFAAYETMALMAAVTKMSAEQGITHVLALVTAPLVRLVSRFGISFKLIGEPTEFHGLRQAVLLDLTADLSVVAAQRPDFWRILTASGLYYNPLRP